MSSDLSWTWSKYVEKKKRDVDLLRTNLDPNAPTVVKNRTNLRKDDLFVINFDEKETQKLVIKVDEERSGVPGPSGQEF